jgi:hypothetical protein
MAPDMYAVQEARPAGMPATKVALETAAALLETPLDGMGQFISLTANDEVNSLAVMQFNEWFDREHLYRVTPEEAQEYQLQGRLIPFTYRQLRDRIHAGWEIRQTTLTEVFDQAKFEETHSEAMPLFAITDEGKFRAAPVPMRAGCTIFSLVPGQVPNMSGSPETHGN